MDRRRLPDDVPAASRRLAAWRPSARDRRDGGRGSGAATDVHATGGDGGAVATVPRRRGADPVAPLPQGARPPGRVRRGDGGPYWARTASSQILEPGSTIWN